MSQIVEADDQGLVAQAQDGDRKAFAELVRRHQAAIYRVCFRILFDEEDAADATQETFLRAYNKLSTFDRRSAFKTWLVRVAVNVSLNARGQQPDRLPLDDLSLPPSPSAESIVMRTEAVGQLYRALQALPFNHRVAVILRDLEGLSYRHVADMLEVPEGTAKGWAHRGRERLKELLT